MAPKQKQELTFLVSTGPGDGEENRRRVRSLAALKSWPGRRRRTFQQFEDSLSNHQAGAGAFLLETPSTPVGPSTLRPAHDWHATSSPTDRTTVDVQHRLDRPGEARIVPIYSSATSSGPRGNIPSVSNKPCHCWDCQLRNNPLYRQPDRFRHSRRCHPCGITTRSRLLMLPLFPEPGRPFSGRLEPFNQYPIQDYAPWHDEALSHMMKIFAPRGWPILRITDPEGLEWENFCHLISLSEPAFFYVRLLFASGDLVRLGRFPPSTTIYLRAKAVAAINEAFFDPERATSDGLILAAGRIAIHECYYGDQHAAHHVHRPAQARMIEMRGGLEKLEFPALMKRLMRWADDLMSRQGKTRKFLAEEGPKREYTVVQTLNVLERWVPKSGEKLRNSLDEAIVLSDAKDGW